MHLRESHMYVFNRITSMYLTESHVDAFNRIDTTYAFNRITLCMHLTESHYVCI